MKKLYSLLIFILTLCFSVNITSAAMIDITNPLLPHFANFTNDFPAFLLSNISKDTPASYYGDFGWHDSPTEHLPEYAGILLDSSYAVTTLRLQVHRNPFRDFILQGSNNTISGIDGSWDALLSSTVTERSELSWQTWNFSNTNSYSAYRIKADNDYVGGWAMYRWELLADNSNAVPEPGTIFLLGSGLTVLFVYRKK